MPTWPYVAPHGHGGTAGLAWFGANESGFENAQQLSTVFQNYSMVVFGWQALLTAPANYSRELSLLVEQCQIVKKTLTSQGYADTPVIVYCDNLRVQPFYGALSKIMHDPLYQDFFLRAPGLNTSQGEAGYIPATTYCQQMGQQPDDPKCLCWYWNLFNESAVDYYLNELLLPQAKLPGFDGFFFDGSDGFMRGTWKHATNVPVGRTDDDALQAVISFHKKGAELLRKHGKYAIYSEHLVDTTPAQQQVYSREMAGTGFARFYEGFRPTEDYIEMILGETQPPSDGPDPLPVVVHAAGNDGELLMDAFATFLVVRSNYSYFMASRGWLDGGWQWHPEYDIEVGNPLGPAQKHIVGSAVVYTRNYSKYDVSVQCGGETEPGPSPVVALLQTSEAEGGWSCKLVNCSCADFANYYGTHPGKGFGCAPTAAQDWWKAQPCHATAGAETCCGGPACHLPGHAPCICPKGPGPWPPARPCKGTIQMKNAFG